MPPRLGRPDRIHSELFRFDDVVDLFVEVALATRRGAANANADFHATLLKLTIFLLRGVAAVYHKFGARDERGFVAGKEHASKAFAINLRKSDTARNALGRTLPVRRKNDEHYR